MGNSVHEGNKRVWSLSFYTGSIQSRFHPSMGTPGKMGMILIYGKAWNYVSRYVYTIWLPPSLLSSWLWLLFHTVLTIKLLSDWELLYKGCSVTTPLPQTTLIHCMAIQKPYSQIDKKLKYSGLNMLQWNVP